MHAVAVMALFSIFQAVYASSEITINEWEIPTPDSAPHDVVVGKNGLVWFTEIATNKIGQFDPKTEQFKEYQIPTPSSRPHGLAVDDDGNVWFTEVGAGKIGKLDPNSSEIQEYDTPTTNSGPHTPIFAEDGILWFTEQGVSQIGRLDTKNGQMTEYPTLTQSANPYGIIADADGNAWFAELRGGITLAKLTQRLAKSQNMTHLQKKVDQEELQLIVTAYCGLLNITWVR